MTEVRRTSTVGFAAIQSFTRSPSLSRSFDLVAENTFTRLICVCIVLWTSPGSPMDGCPADDREGKSSSSSSSMRLFDRPAARAGCIQVRVHPVLDVRHHL